MNIKFPSGIVFLVTSLLLLCSGCSSVHTDRPTSGDQLLWPSPPAEPRYRYVATLFSSDDIEIKAATDRFREMLTGSIKPAYRFMRPLDIAAYQGRLYIIDSSTPTVQVFDLQRRKHFHFGYRFEGKLVRPVSIIVDGKGHVYVADRGRNSIIIYDSMGLYQRQISLKGIVTQLAGITVDADGEFIYVVDRGGIDSDTHQVVKINNRGDVIKAIGRRGKNATEFNLPVDIAIDRENRLYVLDAGNFRVQLIDSNGRHITSWGRAGNGLGQFGMPRSIALDRTGNVYVTDAQFGNIQIFSSSGKLLMHLGSLSHTQGPGNYALITGVTMDQKGYLYVLDQYLRKLDIYKKLTLEERMQFKPEKNSLQ